MGPQLGNKEDTLESEIVSTKQLRIAKLAKQSRTTSFLSLNHFIDLDWLRVAYHKTRKDGAVGVDGQTAKDYEANLEKNLRSLLERAKSGSYYAPPVRRVHIPKDKPGETRPLGIPTFEDKVLQRAVVMILEPLYEQDFKDCSYGFRPGRSAHGALQAHIEQQDRRIEQLERRIVELESRLAKNSRNWYFKAFDKREAAAS